MKFRAPYLIFCLFQYLTAVPKSYSDNTIVISCEDDRAACDSAIKAGLPVVSAEFILTGALRQEADLTSYPFLCHSHIDIQYNFNAVNTDGLFSVADSNSCLRH